jgi:hypothetical protein
MNGVLLRTEVDKVTGQLSDTRSRFLGTRPPKLFPVSVRGRRSMLALSSRPWLVRACALVQCLQMLPSIWRIAVHAWPWLGRMRTLKTSHTACCAAMQRA